MARHVHILTGTFASHEAAEVFCYDIDTADTPEAINMDQPAATIDTDSLEMAFLDEIPAFLSAFLPPATVDWLIARAGEHNTLIAIADTGLLGDDAELQTTDTLTYHGLLESIVP